MSTLVARLRAEVDEEVNEPLDRLLDDAADRIASLEMALVELSQTRGGWPRNANIELLAAHVRWAAKQALRPQPTDDKINDAFKRATQV